MKVVGAGTGDRVVVEGAIQPKCHGRSLAAGDGVSLPSRFTLKAAAGSVVNPSWRHSLPRQLDQVRRIAAVER